MMLYSRAFAFLLMVRVCLWYVQDMYIVVSGFCRESVCVCVLNEVLVL